MTEGIIQATKLNESFYQISGTPEQLQPIIRRLQVAIPGAYFDPMVKRGLKKGYAEFYVVQNGKLIIPSGLIPFLSEFGVLPTQRVQEFTKADIDMYIATLNLPFTPYDYQLEAVYDSIINQQQICLAATSAGKSVIIGLISGFFHFKGLKGLILVPSINLTIQLLGDFKDYNLDSLVEDTHLIGGDNTDKNLNNQLTVSTWQSARLMKEQMKTLNYVIIDEAHGLKDGTESADIIYKAINAKYRIGLTGTLPEDKVSVMSLLSLVGAPKRYVTTQGLINRGLATPVNINVLNLQYSPDDKAIFRHVGNFSKQLQFVKEHENRNKFISKLAIGTSKTGNTVIMHSHVQHMKDVYIQLMEDKFPEVEVENKHITGKNALEFQNQYNIYYIAGSTKVKDRTHIINIIKDHGDAIIVTNYSLFSTGLSAKGIKNIIFASPMKSFVTISQSIGRAIRLHVSKDSAEIFDLVDMFTPKGTFAKQYNHRYEKSYLVEGFPVHERSVHI